MSTELGAPISFAQEVTDKVRQLIMNAMPEEKLQGILNAEYKKYFEGTNGYNGYYKSKFEEMVEQAIRSEMHTRILNAVKEYLQGIDMGIEERTKEILAAITPAVMQGFQQHVAADVARTFINNFVSQRPF